jgi:hypothetical protein
VLWQSPTSPLRLKFCTCRHWIWRGGRGLLGVAGRVTLESTILFALFACAALCDKRATVVISRRDNLENPPHALWLLTLATAPLCRRSSTASVSFPLRTQAWGSTKKAGARAYARDGSCLNIYL